MDVNTMFRVMAEMQIDVRPLNIRLVYDDGTTLEVMDLDGDSQEVRVEYVPRDDPWFYWTYEEGEMSYSIGEIRVIRSVRGIRTTAYLTTPLH